MAFGVQNAYAVGTTSGPIFAASGLNTCLTATIALAWVTAPRKAASWVGPHEGNKYGNGQRGNGAMDVKEGNVRTFVPNAILAGFAALLA